MIIAVVMTTIFGVLTSLVDTLVFTSPDLYWKMFAVMYIRGYHF